MTDKDQERLALFHPMLRALQDAEVIFYIPTLRSLIVRAETVADPDIDRRDKRGRWPYDDREDG